MPGENGQSIPPGYPIQAEGQPLYPGGNQEDQFLKWLLLMTAFGNPLGSQEYKNKGKPKPTPQPTPKPEYGTGTVKGQNNKIEDEYRNLMTR